MADNIEESGVYKSLAELDSMLKKAVETVDKAFNGFENLEDSSIKYAQEKLDIACEQISNKINTTLEKKKKDACASLKSKYKQAQDSTKTLKPIVDLISMDISLDTIVSGLKKTITAFATPYVKPYQDAVTFVTEFVTKATPLINSISSNTQKLLSVKSRVEDHIKNINPNLNVDKLKISFTPPNIKDITG